MPTPEDTPPATPDTPRPSDLVDLREAAALVDRAKSTVRTWCREGKLTKHREYPGDPNSRAMVSRAELMAHAAAHLDPDPPQRHRPAPAGPSPSITPPPATPDPDAARLAGELAGLRVALEATRAHVASLQTQLSAEDGRVQAEQRRAEQAETRAAELRADLEEARDALQAERAERRALATIHREELAQLRAELDRVRTSEGARVEELRAALDSYAGLPWWRRMVTGPTLSGPTPSATPGDDSAQG